MPRRPSLSQYASTPEDKSCNLQTPQQHHCTNPHSLLGGQFELPYLRNWCNENDNVEDCIDNTCYEQEEELIETCTFRAGDKSIPQVAQRPADCDIADSNSKSLADHDACQDVEPKSKGRVLKGEDATVEKND